MVEYKIQKGLIQKAAQTQYTGLIQKNTDGEKKEKNVLYLDTFAPFLVRSDVSWSAPLQLPAPSSTSVHPLTQETLSWTFLLSYPPLLQWAFSLHRWLSLTEARDRSFICLLHLLR